MAAMLVYDEERQRIETMNSSLSPRRRPSPQNFTFLSYHNSPLVNASLLHYRPGSIAEQTIVSHQPGGNAKPLITKADRIQYPKNPENGYISRHSTIFRGCLCCRKEGHLFITCSQNRDKVVRNNYWQELWCHIPSTRKRNTVKQEERLSRHHNTPVMHLVSKQSTLIPLGIGQGINAPSWISHPPSSSPTSPSKAPEDGESYSKTINPWILPILIGVDNNYVKGSTLIPININNNVPCADFKLSQRINTNISSSACLLIQVPL